MTATEGQKRRMGQKPAIDPETSLFRIARNFSMKSIAGILGGPRDGIPPTEKYFNRKNQLVMRREDNRVGMTGIIYSFKSNSYYLSLMAPRAASRRYQTSA
jgi:hypothetical protein